ncbi:MAG: HAMP domain-containing histidine kinase [Treponema sp.]|nr:HAMP domain-containing histidine kinase [Treponema sp.]
MNKFGKKKQSFSVRLSLRFMFLLTMTVIFLSFAFLFFIRSLVHSNQTAELKKAEAGVYEAVKSLVAYGDSRKFSGGPAIYEIPYYFTYVVWDFDTNNIIATNDPFLPLLEPTKGKSVRYFVKDFFFDGDLDIQYYAQAHSFGGRRIVVAVAMDIENSSTSMIFSKLPLALLFLSLPILLLSFFVSLFITKNTISPVVKITKAAQTMSTKNLDSLLPLSGRGDEIDELSDTFNELFLRIKADFDRERQFSSDVSHELNTPLTVISGQANLLLRWGKDNPEQLEKSLKAIKNESKSMHAIIENLLQISRIESGRIKPQICKTEISGLFTRVEEEFAALAPDVEFDLDCPAPVSMQTDPEMLHQILTVLLSNSVKFAGKKCRIGLKLRQEDGHVIIEESDDGPGISEEALPHIFERFFRADQAHTRKAGGSGLGLAIAKTLCQTLGAEITAGNAEPKGAVFTITFNCAET